MEELPVFTQRRENGVLYFRRPIPKNLQPFLNAGNKREITVSLKSKKITAAVQRRYAELLADSTRLLKEAAEREKAAMNGVPAKPNESAPRDSIQRRPILDFAQSELRAIVHRWLSQATTETLENARIAFNYGDAADREAALESNASRLASLQKLPGAAASLEVDAMKRTLIEEAGGFIPHLLPGSDALRLVEFDASIREGLIRLAKFEREILTTGIPPKLEIEGVATSETATAQIASTAPSLTLDALIEQFEKDPQRQNITEKTRDEFQIVFSTLREMIGGATPVASIRREQLKEIQTVCLALPARYSRHYPGKTLREIVTLAKKDGKPPMNPTTFNKRMTLLAGVFAYAVREHVIPASPALGLRVATETAEPGESSYSIAQLNRIFTGAIYQAVAENGEGRFKPGDASEPHQFWTPIIGLFQGMRENEILQLGPQDVAEVDGIQCLKIGHREDYKVKKNRRGHSSKRTAPIHPELIRLGFLRFVEAARKAKLTDLFPDASPGKTYGNRSHNYSKRFRRFLEQVSVKTSRKECFHSLRHTWIDGMRSAGVPVYAYKRIGGWSYKESVSDTYGGRIMPYLYEQLSKLKFEGLDLSLLEPK